MWVAHVSKPATVGKIIGASIAIAAGADPYAIAALLIIGYVLEQMNKPPKMKAEARSRMLSGRDPQAPWRIVYGAPRLAGTINYMQLSGPNNEFLNVVYTLAVGDRGESVAASTINNITAMYFDNEVITLDAGITAGASGTDKWSGLVYCKGYVGSSSQTADTTLIAESEPDWFENTTGVRFDGVNHYTVTAPHATLNPAAITVEIAVRPRNSQLGWLVCFYDGTNYYGLRMNADRKVEWIDSAGNGVTSATALTLHTQYYVSVTAAAGGVGSEIFIDGVSDASNGTNYTVGDDDPLIRFGSKDGGSQFFPGDLDYPRLWSEVRGDSDILANIATDTPTEPSPTTLVSNWKFDEGSGSFVADSGTASNTGTLNPVWTTVHRGRGTAYVYLRLKWDSTIFSNGLPNVTFDLEGRKVRDPRLSPTASAYSDNPALCLADYLTNNKFGLGIAEADIDDTLLATAATECEDAVSLAAGGTEERYTVNGSFTTDKTPQTIIGELLAAMSGRLAWVGGKWGIYAGAYVAPTVTLTESDFRGPLRVSPLAGRSASFNAVKGVFIDADNNHQPADFAPVTNATYQTEDGGRRIYSDVAFPYTTSASRAQRLAKIILEQRRQATTVNIPGRLSCWQLQPPQNVAVTYARFGWTAKVFEVKSSILIYDPRTGELGCNLVLNETASGLYDWSEEETTVDLAPNSNLPSAVKVIPPTGLTLQSGLKWNTINVTWTAPVDQYVTDGGKFEIEYRLSGQSPEDDWRPGQPIDGSRVKAFLSDVKASLTYDVRLRSINSVGIASPWEQVNDHIVLTASPGKWTTGVQLGSDLNIAAGSGLPALAAMNETDVAYIESNEDDLRMFRFDSEVFAQVGNDLNIPSGAAALASLSATRVAFIDIADDDLRTYDFDEGTGNWTKTGNDLNISDVATVTITAMSSSRIALFDTFNKDLRAYDFDETDWAQVGSDLPITATTSGASLAAMNSTDVAYIDNGNDNLRLYRFTESTGIWAQVGNGLNIPLAAAVDITSLNATDIAYIDNVNGVLRTYRFDGTDWAKIGTDTVITGFGNIAISAMNGTDIAFYDSSNKDLRKYRFNFSIE